MTEDEKDELVDDAVHAVNDAFYVCGVDIPEEELFALNDYLTVLLRKLTN